MDTREYYQWCVNAAKFEPWVYHLPRWTADQKLVATIALTGSMEIPPRTQDVLHLYDEIVNMSTVPRSTLDQKGDVEMTTNHREAPHQALSGVLG